MLRSILVSERAVEVSAMIYEHCDLYSFQKELLNVEEKYKRAMMTSAQLDNDKQTYRYQVELLKDEMEETTEQLVEVQREHRDRCKVGRGEGRAGEGRGGGRTATRWSC